MLLLCAALKAIVNPLLTSLPRARCALVWSAASADATQGAKIFRLSLVGFKRAEIAAMMQTSLQVVSQSIYAEKNKGKKRPAK